MGLASLDRLEKWFPLKSERGSFPVFFIQPSPLSSLLSCSFYLLDQRTISGVEILKMTGKTAQSYYVLIRPPSRLIEDSQ